MKQSFVGWVAVMSAVVGALWVTQIPSWRHPSHVVRSRRVDAASSPANSRPAKPRRLTFAKDIAPIVFAKCLPCHRPGETAPFALGDYHSVLRRAQLIRQVVESRAMPPWKAGPCDFKFQNDESLSKDQIQAFTGWIESGMDEGDPKDLPKKPVYTTDWPLGKPDLVVEMSKPFPVPADGPDLFRDFVLPLHLEHDVYVKAIDMEPSTRRLVHHCLFYFDSARIARQSDGRDGLPGFDGTSGNVLGAANHLGSWIAFVQSARKGANFGGLGGWQPGLQQALLPDSIAYFLPKDADLILAAHLHPSGRSEFEKIRVGLYLSKKPASRRFLSLMIPPDFALLSGLDIPPGERRYQLQDSFRLPVDCFAFQTNAHAHQLCSSAELTAKMPSGVEKKLLNIPDWDFNWQSIYHYETPVFLPQGTVLSAKLVYDNSADNPRNPNVPPREVRWGLYTVDEMGSTFLSVIPRREEDYEVLRGAIRDHVRQVAREHHTESLARAGELD